jgi:hypothetical protein
MKFDDVCDILSEFGYHAAWTTSMDNPFYSLSGKGDEGIFVRYDSWESCTIFYHPKGKKKSEIISVEELRELLAERKNNGE